MNDLNVYRSEIDLVDEDIIKLLAKRQELAKKIGLHKSQSDMTPFQPVRHRTVIDKRQETAVKYGLKPSFVGMVWQLLMAEAVRVQQEISDAKTR